MAVLQADFKIQHINRSNIYENVEAENEQHFGEIENMIKSVQFLVRFFQEPVSSSLKSAQIIRQTPKLSTRIVVFRKTFSKI